MPINPNIALAVKAPDIQIPNMLAQAAQIAQLREAQAVAEERNKLRALNPTAPDYEAQLFRVSPQLGIAHRKERTASEANEAARQKSLVEAASARQGMLGQAMRDISQRPSDANITAHLEDVLTSPLFSKEEKASVQARSEMLLGMPFAERSVFLASQGAKASELKPGTQQINRLGQTDVVQIPAFGGAPATIGTYADVPLPPAVAAQKKDIARAGAPTITNVQEKAEAGKYGELIVKQFDDISKQATVAAKTLPSIEANLALIDRDFDTGFGTETKAGAARILAALGVENADKFATSAQVFQSNAINAVLQKQLEQKGPQTESDARRIEQIGSELGKTKAANRAILDIAKEQLRRDIEQRNFYANWKKGPGKGSFEGAEDAWFAGEGGKSLFDRPALQKYLPRGPAAQQIPTTRTPAPAAAPAAAARTVVRTGTLNGRRVVQYSDGSTEYAD